MQRGIRDLIPLFIQIEEAFSRLYHNVSVIEGHYNPKIKTMAAVLSRQEKEHAKYYERMTGNKVLLDEITISESYYQGVMKILHDFKSTISRGSFRNTNEFLKYAINYEQTYGNMIKELLEMLDDENSSELKKLFKTLISAEENHSRTLESFLKES